MALQFKLRFDQGQDNAGGPDQLERARQDKSQGNKGNIDHAKIDKFRDMLAGKKTRVRLLTNNDTRIVADFPRELSLADINRINLLCPALQKAISESTGRRADVERNGAGDIDRKMVQRAAQF